MAHHSSELSEEVRALLRGKPETGPTGEYPHGKLTADDHGEIRIAIAADPERGVVIIEFGKPVAWIGFTPEQAVELADLIHRKAWEIRGICE